MEYKKLVLTSYGVEIGIESNDSGFLEKLIKGIGEILPVGYELTEACANACLYRIKVLLGDNNLEFFIDGKLDVKTNSFETFMPYFLSLIRLRIAEYAVSRVFIHAGAIVWNEKAVIFPARSFQGKTTLIAELIKNGAGYLSDEYAVLDQDGLVHSFPKTLSVRGIGDKLAQTEIPFEEYGAKAGAGPYLPGMVIFTEFEAGAEWKPEFRSPGQGMLEIISHTIPIRYNPKFTLEVLNKILNRVIIAKSKRGDSKDFVKTLFNFFENHLK